MEITPHAPPARVFTLTVAFFGSQWPYLCLFALGHPLCTRVAAPITFSILLLLLAAAPHNFDKLAGVRNGALLANPYVQALTRAASAMVGGGGAAFGVAVTPKQAVVALWWALLLAAFWLLITLQRRAEAADRAAFASDLARAAAAAASSSSSADPAPLPRLSVRDSFASCVWLFGVCPVLLMADIVAVTK